MNHSSTLHEIPTDTTTSNDVLDYLQNKHATVINNYKNPDGYGVESCALLALRIAEILIATEKKPYIIEVYEAIEEDGIRHGKCLRPLIYGGKVEFRSHQICCCDGEAFDPILGQPIAIDEYCKKVFGEEINMDILFSPDKTKEIVKRKSA